MSFIVTTVRETGTITYHCATPSYALEKIEEFRRAEYRCISVRTSENLIFSETALRSLADGDGARIRH